MQVLEAVFAKVPGGHEVRHWLLVKKSGPVHPVHTEKLLHVLHNDEQAAQAPDAL